MALRFAFVAVFVLAVAGQQAAPAPVLCTIDNVSGSRLEVKTAAGPLTLFADSRTEIWKVPAAGGTAARVFARDAAHPAIAPDGRQLAFYLVPESTNAPWSLGVMPIDGANVTATFSVNPAVAYATVRWTRDGKALLHNSALTDRANIWLQPLPAGEPRQLTHFADQTILGFDVSSDGRSLLIARGALTRDAILIKGF